MQGAAHAGTAFTYTDAAGDGRSAPDVRTVTLTDGCDGTVAVEIALAADLLGDDATVIFAVDSEGAEYAVVLNATGAVLVTWDCSWVPFPHSEISPRMESGRVSFTLTLADLGSPASFGFWVVSTHGGAMDVSPEKGVFTYPQALRSAGCA